MALGIVVDVGDQVYEMGIAVHFHSAEGVAKEASASLVRFVERFCVGVEQVTELLRGGTL